MGSSREEIIDKISVDILSKIPDPFDIDTIRKNYGINITPTTVVLLQELERFNKLINKMSSSLNLLGRVSHYLLRVKSRISKQITDIL